MSKRKKSTSTAIKLADLPRIERERCTTPSCAVDTRSWPSNHVIVETDNDELRDDPAAAAAFVYFKSLPKDSTLEWKFIHPFFPADTLTQATCQRCEMHFDYWVKRWPWQVNAWKAPKLCRGCQYEVASAIDELEKRIPSYLPPDLSRRLTKLVRSSRNGGFWVDGRADIVGRRFALLLAASNRAHKERLESERQSSLSSWFIINCPAEYAKPLDSGHIGFDGAAADEALSMVKAMIVAGQVESIVFMGWTGTGKTRTLWESLRLMVPARYARTNPDYCIRIVRGVELSALMEDPDELTALCETDLLIIDDLQDLAPNRTNLTGLKTIMEYRTSQGIPSWVTVQATGKDDLTDLLCNGSEGYLRMLAEAVVRRMGEFSKPVRFLKQA